MFNFLKANNNVQKFQSDVMKSLIYLKKNDKSVNTQNLLNFFNDRVKRASVNKKKEVYTSEPGKLNYNFWWVVHNYSDRPIFKYDTEKNILYTRVEKISLHFLSVIMLYEIYIVYLDLIKNIYESNEKELNINSALEGYYLEINALNNITQGKYFKIIRDCFSDSKCFYKKRIEGIDVFFIKENIKLKINKIFPKIQSDVEKRFRNVIFNLTVNLIYYENNLFFLRKYYSLFKENKILGIIHSKK